MRRLMPSDAVDGILVQLNYKEESNMERTCFGFVDILDFAWGMYKLPDLCAHYWVINLIFDGF
jgi:hypothetical protein